MKIYTTRASVHPGDDGDAPHATTIDLPGEISVNTAIEKIIASRYLPSISGGNATWSVMSSIPIAVAAQQWEAPRYYHLYDGLDRLDIAAGTLRLHFNYHAQIDPEIVFRIFWGVRLRAV
jgi:hypothetical protein